MSRPRQPLYSVGEIAKTCNLHHSTISKRIKLLGIDFAFCKGGESVYGDLYKKKYILKEDALMIIKYYNLQREMLEIKNHYKLKAKG